jgi:outer membrane protein TolC
VLHLLPHRTCGLLTFVLFAAFSSVAVAEDTDPLPLVDETVDVHGEGADEQARTDDGSDEQPLAVEATPDEPRASSSPSRRITVEEYLARVRSESPMIQLQDHQVDAALARRMEARSAAWPVIDLRGGMSPAPNIDVELDELGRPLVAADQRTELELLRDVVSIGVRLDTTITIPITTFGRIRIARQLGDLGLDLAEVQREKAIREQLFDAWRAYLAAQWYTEVSALLDEASRRLRRAEEELEDEIDAGNFRARTDLRRLTITSAQFTSLQADANAAGQVARFAIARGLNLRPDFEVDPLDEDLPREGVTLDDVLAYARAHRPDYRLLDQAVRASELQERLRWREFSPELGLILNLNIAYTPSVTDIRGPFIFNPFNRFLTGFALGLRWSLNPRQTWARARRAQADVAIADTQRAAAWLGIEIEVAEAWHAANGAREVYLSSRSAVRAAEAWLNQVSFQYDQGLAEFSDFREPLLTFYQTRAGWYKAVLDYHLALANLRLKVGADGFGVWPRLD